MTKTRMVRSSRSLFTQKSHAYLDKHVLFFRSLYERISASIVMCNAYPETDELIETSLLPTSLDLLV